MGKRRTRNVNAKGRKISDQYANLGYPLMRALARNLSGSALKLWVELRTRFYGGGQCDVYMSLDEAVRLLDIGKSTAKRSFDELETKGFIAMVEEGSWYWSRATRWRFTDKPYNGMLTNDWKQKCVQKQNPGTEVKRKKGQHVPSENREP